MAESAFDIGKIVSDIFEHKFVRTLVTGCKIEPMEGEGSVHALNIPQSKPYNQPEKIISNLTKYQAQDKKVEFMLDGKNPRAIRWKYSGLEGVIHITYIAPDDNWGDFTKPPK